MIVPPTSVRVLVAMKPVDFRKGMDGLAAFVQNELNDVAPVWWTPQYYRRRWPRCREEHVERMRQNSDAAADRVGGAVTLAFCWSHFRRRFYDIAVSGNAPIATEALERIGALYRIEAEISGRSAEERRAERQVRTKPLIENLKTWLETQRARVPGRSEIAKDMRYGLSHWKGSFTSSTTVASRLTRIESSEQSGRSPSIAKTHCLPVATKAEPTGQSSLRSSNL